MRRWRMPLDPNQPFSRVQGEAAGLSWRQLAGPRFQKLFRGVYVSAEVTVTPIVRARAALVATGGRGAICSVSAAAVRRLPVPVCEDVHVLMAPDEPRVRKPGIVIHRGSAKLSEYRGIVLTTMVETFLQVAKDYPLVDAVVLGDAMVLKGYTTPRALVVAAAGASGHGVARARRAAALVRSHVDSPQESRLRLLMLFIGLPEPEVAHEVIAAGRARLLDTAYPQWRVAVEYDGRHHVERDQQWSDDIERREQLGDQEWRIVTITGKQMWNPERVLSRIRRALEKAGAALPPVDQTWRRYFPEARPLTDDDR